MQLVFQFFFGCSDNLRRQTTRPSWESRTKVLKNEKLLTRTHKVKVKEDFSTQMYAEMFDIHMFTQWCAKYQVPVITKETGVLEIEVCETAAEGAGHESHGLVRLSVMYLMDQDLEDATFFLKKRDGQSRSSSVSISVRFVKEFQGTHAEVFSAEVLEMPKENPLWISSWDAAAVLAFKEEQSSARERVITALKQDTIQDLEGVIKVCLYFLGLCFDFLGWCTRHEVLIVMLG